MQKILLIVNPVSGMNRARTALPSILQTLCTGGKMVTVCMTEYAGHAEELAAQLGAGFDVVACTGGDGTLSSVINGLMTVPASVRPTLGYVPLGTVNDMASAYGIQKNPRMAAKRILEGKTIPLDVGKCTSGYFGYVIAFGAFTEVSYETPQDVKNVFGRLAYFAEGAANLQKLKPRHAVVEYDGGVLEDDFLFGAVSNSTSVAGILKIDPTVAVLDDGIFEVMLIRNPKNAADLNNALSSIITQNYTGENVMLLHSRKVKITCDEPVAWTRDGEDGGTVAVMEAEVCHRALRLLV